MRVLALILTVVTGFSGLVYEVAWQKFLATLLGSHAEATAAVLGIFLGGLSLGYSLFGRVTRGWMASGRAHRLLVLYGVVEGSIGVYAMVFPWLFVTVQNLSARLPLGVTGVGFAFDVALCALMIGPPTVLMGGTIPILTQALSRSTVDSTRFHAFVYSFNTAGAFAGALSAGFLLIPRLGLVGVMWNMALVNLTAGAIFGALGLVQSPKGSPGAADISAARPRIAGFARYATGAVLIGFSMMAVQTVLIRVAGLSFGASQFTFTMVVAVFVLCIALGSLGVSLLPRVPESALAVNQWCLVLMLGLLYLALPNAPYGAHVLRTLFRDTEAAFAGFQAAAFLALLLAVGPAVVLSGASLPLLFHRMRREVGDLGDVAGRLYGWNTLGSLLGALVGGYLLLFWLGLDDVYRVALVALVTAALLLGSARPDRARTVSRWMTGPALLACAALGAWGPESLAQGLFRFRTPTPTSYDGPAANVQEMRKQVDMIFYEDGPVLSAAVVEIPRPNGNSRSIINNGKPDGDTFGDYPTMGLAAIVPSLLANQVERAFVIGFGTGVTVGELAILPGVAEVTVAEIAPSVMNAAPLFDPYNFGAASHPKVRVERSDAYRALLRSSDRYDVVVSEPSNPWVAGVEMLYSREFLNVARDRLTPGGVYAQWFHLYDTDEATLSLVLRTYASVFERVSVWFGLGNDLILMGFKEGGHPLDIERLEARYGRPHFREALARSQVKSFPALLAHEVLPLGVLNAAGFEGDIHSLLHPLLSDRAARAFYRGAPAYLPFTGFGRPAAVGSGNSLLRRRYPGARSPEIANTLCSERVRECATVLGWLWRLAPGAPELLESIESVQRRAARVDEVIDANLVSQISLLFAVDPENRSPVPLALARAATRNYTTYYFHAIPFSPEALLDLWNRCVSPAAPEACETGRSFAQKILSRGIQRVSAGGSADAQGSPRD